MVVVDEATRPRVGTLESLRKGEQPCVDRLAEDLRVRPGTPVRRPPGVAINRVDATRRVLRKDGHVAMCGRARDPDRIGTRVFSPLPERALSCRSRRVQEAGSLAHRSRRGSTLAERPVNESASVRLGLFSRLVSTAYRCEGIDSRDGITLRRRRPRLEGARTPATEGSPRASLRRQPPLSARADARRDANGSSPVSNLKATGICLRRGTPSFCRSTSQWALAVLGEMPRTRPTSSFDRPCAINSITLSLPCGDYRMDLGVPAWPQRYETRRPSPPSVGRRISRTGSGSGVRGTDELSGKYDLAKCADPQRLERLPPAVLCQPASPDLGRGGRRAAPPIVNLGRGNPETGPPGSCRGGASLGRARTRLSTATPRSAGSHD